MKQFLAIILAILLCVAALSSCNVTFSGSSEASGPITEAADAMSVTEETTAKESESPEATTAPETSPTETGDGYSKNY